MNKIDNEEIDLILKDFPENLASLIKESLDFNSPEKKLEARGTLVKMGRTILPHMHKLLDTENDSLRMEAAKIIELITDSRSIPFLLKLLDDTVFDIRWIAAEALIKTGRRSICPLLKAIRDGKSSLNFNSGAHHVLLGLVNKNEKDQLTSLLQSLDNFHELRETAPVQASIALKNVFKCKT